MSLQQEFSLLNTSLDSSQVNSVEVVVSILYFKSTKKVEYECKYSNFIVWELSLKLNEVQKMEMVKSFQNIGSNCSEDGVMDA